MRDHDTTYAWAAADPFNGMSRGPRHRQHPAASSSTTTTPAPSSDITFDVVAAGPRHHRVPLSLLPRAPGHAAPLHAAVLGDQDFEVELEDGAGNTSRIRISAYGGGIEEVYQRVSGGVAGWQNEFETIKIPLADFTADGPHAGPHRRPQGPRSCSDPATAPTRAAWASMISSSASDRRRSPFSRYLRFETFKGITDMKFWTLTAASAIVAASVAARSPRRLRRRPSAVQDVLFAQPLHAGPRATPTTGRPSGPPSISGQLVVLQVNPDLVYPRQSAEPVLYVGGMLRRAAQHRLPPRAAWSPSSPTAWRRRAKLVRQDLIKAWFGHPPLPSKTADARIVAQEGPAGRQVRDSFPAADQVRHAQVAGGDAAKLAHKWAR